MALLKNKIVTLTAEAKIANEVVVFMSATVNSNTDVNTAYLERIENVDLYTQNKAELRGDMMEFRKNIFELEDDLEKDVSLDKEIDTEDVVLEDISVEPEVPAEPAEPEPVEIPEETPEDPTV